MFISTRTLFRAQIGSFSNCGRIHPGKLLALLLLVFLPLGLYAQDPPSTLTDAVEYLSSSYPDSLKQSIRKASDDTLWQICDREPACILPLLKWTANNPKPLFIQQLVEYGIENYKHQHITILLTLKRFLNNKDPDIQNIIAPFKNIEDKWRAEDKIKFTTDSLRGHYIPKDLEDCFTQLDRIFTDTTKAQIKHWTAIEVGINTHLGIGMSLRNNWRLWTGSRLSKYFNELGIYNGEHMSEIIVHSYQKRLKGEDFHLKDQLENYHQFYDQKTIDSYLEWQKNH